MAVKSGDQITIIDVTDAYAVSMTLDAFTFPGGINSALSGSTTTQISALRGNEPVACNVVLAEITKPSGITVSSDNDAMAPTLTIEIASSVNKGGTVKIPVHIGDITIIKEFSYAIAFKGTTGEDGQDGQDAITLTITSSNGTIFKNSAIATTLTAHIYKAGAEVTGQALSALGTIKWYKDGATDPVGTGNTLTIDAGDVTNKAFYIAQLEG